MIMPRFALAALTILALPGCVAKAVVDTAVTAVKVPVKAASAGVDAITTSQSEADETRGRELRKAEERLGKARRQCDAARSDGRYDEKWCPIAEGRSG
jgi:hypothetical protein